MPRLGAETKEHGIRPILEQMAQICADYSGLPDIRTMIIPEIRFFYSRLLPGLLEMQMEAMKK